MEDYKGQTAIIPLGKGGLLTDAPQAEIPVNFLIRANNAFCFNDALEKDLGSRRWNNAVLPSGVVQHWDFWPNDNLQRVFAVLSNGTVYRMPDRNTLQLIPNNVDTTQANLITGNFVSMVQGGAEQQGNSKKLFLFTGNNPVQVVSGDAQTRTNIRAGAADWTGTSQPFAGIVHRNRLWCWGNRNDPSRIYVSLAIDHEDFTTQPYSFSIFSGEAEKLMAAGIFRGVLYVFKYPQGVYYLVDNDSDSLNWYFTKFSGDFGAISPHACVPFMDEMLVANNLGSVTSMKTMLLFNDVSTSDIFHQGKIKTYVDNEVRKDSDRNNRHLFYYADKKRVHISYQSNSGYRNDRILTLDYKNVSQLSAAAQYSVSLPKFTFSAKDQPNCLGTIKDLQKVPRPVYGADDGYIYEMDQVDRWVGDTLTNRTAYTFDVETPHTDLSYMDPRFGPYNKTFDFLEVEYEPCGYWDLLADVFIDGKFHRTLKFTMDSGGNELDRNQLNYIRADGGIAHSKRLPLQGLGKRIGIRLYQSGLGQNVRLILLRIYFNVGGYQTKR